MDMMTSLIDQPGGGTLVLYVWTDEDGEQATTSAAFATHDDALADVIDFYQGTGDWEEA